jgi:hypothetical protein
VTRLAVSTVAAWLVLVGAATAAVRPADGNWQASSALGP